ncbi:MAG: hypothetical protein H0W21_01105 [Actinobacteria bacterium]|nr:hypothetical protein [Actinomycetota bacterium]
MLVVQRGWAPDRYRKGLASTLTQALLADKGARLTVSFPGFAGGRRGGRM